MGAQASKTKLQPAQEPTALLATDAGVIVRTIDADSGKSLYHHNPHDRIPATVTLQLRNATSASATTSPHVPVARLGDHNKGLKGKVVYITKAPPRSPSTS